MRVCLVSSSFYPAIFYGGPISSTWDLSKKLGEKNIEVYVSTTNADGNKRIKDIDTKEHIKQAENVFVRYYHEQLINIFSFSFLFFSGFCFFFRGREFDEMNREKKKKI